MINPRGDFPWSAPSGKLPRFPQTADAVFAGGTRDVGSWAHVWNQAASCRSSQRSDRAANCRVTLPEIRLLRDSGKFSDALECVSGWGLLLDRINDTTSILCVTFLKPLDLGSILLIAVYIFLRFHGYLDLRTIKPVFFLETIALWAFGVSWLVKGQTFWRDSVHKENVKKEKE